MTEAVAGILGFVLGAIVGAWVWARTRKRLLDEAIVALQEANRILREINEARALGNSQKWTS